MKTTSNFFQWGTLALMMAVACPMWTACSDDDDDDNATEETPETGLQLSDLEGTYLEATTGYWWGGSAWDECDYTDTVKIVINDADASTVSVQGFTTSQQDLIGTVDLEAKTITFAADQPFYTWYTFSAETAQTTPVEATIGEDGVITVSGWAAWYGGYAYTSGMVSTLTKQ